MIISSMRRNSLRFRFLGTFTLRRPVENEGEHPKQIPVAAWEIHSALFREVKNLAHNKRHSFILGIERAIAISAARCCLIFLVTFLPPHHATAQSRSMSKMDRDLITLSSGKEIRCTVRRISKTGTLDYSSSAKRVKQLEKSKYANVITINDRLEEFFARFDKIPKRDITALWKLCVWAKKDLPEMSRLLAYRCLCLDSNFRPAHDFLKHKKTRGDWVWRRGNEYVSEKVFREKRRKAKEIPILRSVHFVLQSNGKLGDAIGNVLDLERVWLDWKERFRFALGVSEDQRELHFRVGFIPPKTKDDRPYFDPGGVWIAYTDFEKPGDQRGRDFFSLLTQQLLSSLYAPLGSYKRYPRRPKLRGFNDRNFWIEIGFGAWYGEQWGGSPGYAKRNGEPQLKAEDAKTVLRWMKDEKKLKTCFFGSTKFLPHLIHWNHRHFFGRSDDTTNYWLTAKAFSFFLLSNGSVPAQSFDARVDGKILKTKQGILRYLRVAYREAKGNSSRLLDRELGFKIEKLERPFVEWLKVISS